MKILIVDRDDVASKLIASRLALVGHEIYEEPLKDQVVERVKETRFDVIFMDPSPLNSARQHVLNIRRAIRYYPYAILLGEQANAQEAIQSGMNDFIVKPIDPNLLDEKLLNAQGLMSLVSRLSDESEDFPSAGGVIAKSAFNQLFLSALDRADRYGEKSFILFVGLCNFNDIYHKEGPSAAEYSIAQLCQNLLKLRRQSDIFGQTAKHEYAFLLQRPADEQEPIQAANRFADMLVDFDNVFTSGGMPFEISVKLIEVPSGQILVEHNVMPKSK